MPFDIDIPTVLILNALFSLLLAGALYLQGRILPAHIGGSRAWIVASLCGAVGAMLFLTQRLIPPFFGFFMPIALLLGNAVAYYLGSCQFYQQRFPVRAIVLGAGVMLPILLWYSQVNPNAAARNGVMSLGLVCLHACHLALVSKHGGKGSAPTALRVILGLLIVVAFLRLIWSMTAPANAIVMNGGTTVKVLAIAYAVFFLSLAMCFLVMCADRIQLELRHLASCDSLTGVLNRRSFMEMAEREFERGRRQGASHSLIYIDLDHFKCVNDQYGHQAGDAVLIDFCRHVEQQLRAMDFLGRFGGEEFLILLPDTDLPDALAVGERIRAGLGSEPAMIPYTVSMGIVELAPESRLDIALGRADALLYKAKENGRNRIEH